MIGKTVSHYEILEKLGEGGMGVVYKARDTHLSRFVAIKVLPPEKTANPERKRRFVQEAKSASALNHPNIITVYDIDHRNGLDFITMEYVAGKPLQRMIPREGMAADEVVRYAVQIAGALDAAHRAGIIHRDLKPSNIMIRGDGLVKVLDFGLAKLVERPTSESDATTTEMVRTGREEIVGTAAYMSPEQVERRRLDARSDIFSFGAVLYEMLAGRRPFEGDSSIVVMAAVVQKEPKPLGETAVKVPPELAGVAARCLQKDPKRRYQTVEELRTALEISERGAAKDPESFPSIAVLPFLNMSEDKEDEYFSDGLTEELINALTQVAGLRVVSRTSVFRYKGVAGDICKVGRKLRVGMALEGSVRRAKNRVRVTAQLVNVDDGYHVWSQRYDREMKDIFNLQDELARAIVETLEVKLVGDQKQQLVKAYPISPEVYDLCLRGRRLTLYFTRGSLERSIEYFESALKEDPRCSLAYAGSGLANACLANFGWLPPRNVMPKAKQAALAALRIDGSIADAHRTLALVRHWYDWDWAGAEEGYRRAIALQPGDAEMYTPYTELLIYLGRFDEAVAVAGQALKIDPVSQEANRVLGVELFYARRYDEAIHHARNALELAPGSFYLELVLGMAFCAKGQYADALQATERGLSLAPGEPSCMALRGLVCARMGRRAEACKILDEFEKRRAEAYFSPVLIGWSHVGLGHTEDALRWMETACEERDTFCAMLKVSPFSDPLRTEPRFQDLLRKIGFAPDQGDAPV